MPGEDTYSLRTCSLRKLLVFNTRENASLAPLARLMKKYLGCVLCFEFDNSVCHTVPHIIRCLPNFIILCI